MTTPPLDDLLAQAREADPADRIDLRDPIATHGDAAIEPMVDWLGDDRLAAFAIRVLERIGQPPEHRAAVIDVLAATDPADLPPALRGDLEWALASMAAPAAAIRRRRTPARKGASGQRGKPGQPGRGYWVMRTSPWERPLVWEEARQGRLRQGWSSEDDQNLEVIAAVIRVGGRLSESQQAARRALRMLTSWDGGMRLGDIVVAPNLPVWGHLSVFRVAGSYAWAPLAPLRWGERLGHVLPVDTLVIDIDRHSPVVSDALRASLRGQTRLYSITACGGDIEGLIPRTAVALDGGPCHGVSLVR